MTEYCLCKVVFEITDPEAVEFGIVDEKPVEFDIDEIGKRMTSDTYQGDYEVFPKINTKQILDTKNKILEENMTVHEITVARVSNAFGGQTVTIGIV